MHALPRRVRGLPGARHREDPARRDRRRPHADVHQLPRRERPAHQQARGPEGAAEAGPHVLEELGDAPRGAGGRMPHLPRAQHRASVLAGERARPVAHQLLELPHDARGARPGARPPDAGRRVLLVPQGAARGDAQVLLAPASHRPDGVFVVPPAARVDGRPQPDPHHDQRHLLHVPRGEARAVPARTSARARGVHELPQPARHEQRADAGCAPAAPVPAVPHRAVPSEHALQRQQPACRRQRRQDARTGVARTATRRSTAATIRPASGSRASAPGRGDRP